MVKEAYCSYEISKLLKEKGFDVPCTGRYSIRSEEFHLDATRLCNNGGMFQVAAPTHQMAMAWLRKNFNLHIDGNIFQDFSNDADDYVVDEWVYWSWNVYSTLNGKIIAEAPFKNDTFDSYEEAVEAALKYSLENLI